jgi:hypothetical protein
MKGRGINKSGLLWRASEVGFTARVLGLDMTVSCLECEPL